MVILGIDGGGTKTEAILCNEKCETIGSFTGKTINFNSVGMKTAKNNLKKVIDGVQKAAGTDKIDAAFIGMSAISDRADRAFTQQFCDGIIKCDNIFMDSDVYIGIESMRTEGAAAMVISGTGSMASGRLPDGKIIHTGGWGYILGDEGSGYAIAVDALRAAISGHEGSAAKTLLSEAVLEFYDISDFNSLIEIFYNPPMPRNATARFAPEVFKCAEAGDAVAAEIMRVHARKLADTASALLRQMPAGTPLGIWGGVMQGSEKFRKLFISFINESFPDTTAALLKYPPQYGAVFAALKEL